MTPPPWDEGPVSALRKQIADLEVLLDTSVYQTQRVRADFDRALAAVRQLRTALEGALEFDDYIGHTMAGGDVVTEMRHALAATAEFEAP